MADFSQEIQDFRRYGTYTYKFDNVGNSIFDSSSINFNQVYIAFPLQNVIYDNSKIKTLYNVEFEEFVPQDSIAPEVVQVDNSQQEQLDLIKEENESLKSQLDSLVAQNEASGSMADSMAVKQVILELRKAVGEGRVDSDFSDTFPYTPVRKDNK